MTRRRVRDPTPAWCLRRLAEVLDLGRLGAPPCSTASWGRTQQYERAWPPLRTAWEPAAGRGHLADVLEDYMPPGCGVDRTDIEPAPGVSQHDFLAADPPPWAHEVAPGLVLTNPPYRHADAFVRRALELVHPAGAVVMLLRITWLGGGDEAHPDNWLHRHPPSVYVLPERPSFTGGGGGDSAPSAWCVWTGREAPMPWGHLRVLATTPLAERRADEVAVHHPDRDADQLSLL